MDLSSMFLAVPEVATAVGVRRQSVHELARHWSGGRKRQGVKGLEFPIAVPLSTALCRLLEKKGGGSPSPVGRCHAGGTGRSALF